MRLEVQKKINNFKDSNLADLSRLQIQDTEIKDILIQMRNLSPNISVFNLDHNNLSDNGAKLLSKYLTSFTQLTEISIQFNRIGTEGALALFSLKRELPDLTILFHGNKIHDASEMLEIERCALTSSRFTWS